METTQEQNVYVSRNFRHQLIIARKYVNITTLSELYTLDEYVLHHIPVALKVKSLFLNIYESSERPTTFNTFKILSYPRHNFY